MRINESLRWLRRGHWIVVGNMTCKGHSVKVNVLLVDSSTVSQKLVNQSHSR